MRQVIKDFIQITAKTLPMQFKEPIFEFGSFQVPGQEEIANLRPIFPGKKYVGTDMRDGTGVDMVLNLHDIDLPSESVGTVICLDTLEHVEYPKRALEEIYRVLMANGMAIISSVMLWPIHDHPNDYWRFTPEAFRSILQPFGSSFIGFAGEESFPHTIVGIGFKGDMPELSDFKTEYAGWQKKNYLQIIGPYWKPASLVTRQDEETMEKSPPSLVSKEMTGEQPVVTNRLDLNRL